MVHGAGQVWLVVYISRDFWGVPVILGGALGLAAWVL
jgi:hypothetical protein